MVRLVLIRPGATDFDDQRRIKGCLDVPLNENGVKQAQQAAASIGEIALDAIYSSPCQSAMETAEILARAKKLRVQSIAGLKNVNHGLWHGKLIDEVRQHQPKVYRQFQEHPEACCPPDGESIADAELRVRMAIEKLLKKHKKGGTVALVVGEPLASLVKHCLLQSEIGDLWEHECDHGEVETLDYNPAAAENPAASMAG
jgi:broad specificity phosphatase PhoE